MRPKTLRHGWRQFGWVMVAAAGLALAPSVSAAEPTPPVSPGAAKAFALTTTPSGDVREYTTAKDGDVRRLSYRAWDTAAQAWTEAAFEGPPLPESAGARPYVFFDRDGVCHLFYMKLRGEGRKIAIDRFIDLWHLRTDGDGWTEPERIFEGYTGSFQDVEQLPSGRIILPFGAWIGEKQRRPPEGCNYVTTVFSDDGGRTWSLSPAKLTTPCFPDYNGANYGAIEPVVTPLRDGRVWMLIRTQAGFLFESFSEDGVSWSTPRATIFVSSDSPAGVTRLPDGRLVVAWNHCDKPPRMADGQGVYAGRDALHLAISDDDGRTWRGFREVYLDHRRHDSPSERGDRGTAYPSLAATPDGQVLISTGQGANGRLHWLVDPAWVEATARRADFTAGNLDGWSVFSEFGPARGFWRDRRIGANLVAHPDRDEGHVLQLAHPADLPADGATWNFPAARQGTLRIRIRLQAGAGPAEIGLSDRFSNPTDDTAPARSLFRLPIHADGRLASLKQPSLAADTWHDIDLRWDLDRRACLVDVDGVEVTALPLRRDSPIGACYLRLSSVDPRPNEAGLLIESVDVEVDPGAGASAGW